MEIYIDVFLLENLIIDFFLIEVTSFLSKIKPHFFRNLGASFLGALGSICSFFITFDFLTSIVFKLFLSVIIIAVSFGINRNFLKCFFCFYISSFVFGGVVFGILSFNSNFGLYIGNGVIYGNNILIKILIRNFYRIFFFKANFLVCKKEQKKFNLWFGI